MGRTIGVQRILKERDDMSQMVEISNGRFVNMSHVSVIGIKSNGYGCPVPYMVFVNEYTFNIDMPEYNKVLAAMMADTLPEKEKV